MAKRNIKRTMTIINLGSKSKTQDGEIKIAKSGIYIGPKAAKHMGVKKGDFILLAEENGIYYMGKRPGNVFGGGRLSAHARTPDRPFVQLKDHTLRKGIYTLGEEVDILMDDEHGKQVTA